jgi:toxin ParE1/3/4
VKTKVFWTPQAREDLLDVYLTIGLDNPTVAERFYAAIEAKTELLASQPRIGPRRPEIRPSARLLIERPYLILYETRPDTDDGPVDQVEIVRVIDGRRDLTSLF